MLMMSVLLKRWRRMFLQRCTKVTGDWLRENVPAVGSWMFTPRRRINTAENAMLNLKSWYVLKTTSRTQSAPNMNPSDSPASKQRRLRQELLQEMRSPSSETHTSILDSLSTAGMTLFKLRTHDQLHTINFVIIMLINEVDLRSQVTFTTYMRYLISYAVLLW